MKPPLRTLLVDDERLAHKRLRALLAAHPEIVIVGEAETVAEAAEIAAREKPALIFLDVQMPPDSGFDLLCLLQPVPAIVFVTAHDEYAARAFEVSAVDYLLKPILPVRLAAAIRRVNDGRPAADAAEAPALRLEDTLILRDGERMRCIRLDEIAAVQAEGHYTRVHLAREPSMFVLRGINTWASRLPAPAFLRVDRSLIVNLARVRTLDIQSRDAAQLTLAAASAPLRLGRVASARLREALPQ